jgi:hypothetical protein
VTPKQLERIIVALERLVDAAELYALAFADDAVDHEEGDLEFARRNVVSNSSGGSIYRDR